ncbi:MAG: PD40 domain-containing protein [Verrucomicrobia bacterium]|nr:PD40 domain-containing protein [Verrucomicrobiota bacterium]
MKLTRLFLTAVLCSVLPVTVLAATDDAIRIDREATASGLDFPPAIPIHITGFSGEVDKTIKNDLFFMGFRLVSEKEARYLLQGKNEPGRVEGVLYDPFTKQTKVAKAFTGSGTRSQTHALADAVAQAAERIPIAQTKIAFLVQPSGVGPGEIYVADYDGYSAQSVTQDGVIVAAPAWGKGSTLFYTSYKFGKPDIFSQNLSTGARKAVARFNGLNSSVAISADGRRLAMILGKSGNPDLYVSDIDGGNLRQLTTGKAVNASPCWSPDGRTICFCSDRTGVTALYTISAEGGALTRVPTTVGRPTEPDWSPDGKYIVFTSQRRGGFDICVVSMDGSRRGQTTSLVEGEDPVWAPNSRAVVFARNVNHRHVLSLLDVPSKQVKDVARISGSASSPSWAR